MTRSAIHSRRRDSQGGFALLMVFLMAAIIALMLYQQLPRVAFESEREKEQLLIDRGEQYTRAIQLYYLANNRTYPTSLDDLEKQQKRFLRRRFVDPFTGKAEWRIIHTNGGFLTDSLVQKPPTAGDSQSQSASNSSNTTNGSTNNSSNNSNSNTTAADAPPQVNAAVLQRPSDRPLTPPGFGQTLPVQDPSGQAQPVNTPLPPITLTPQPGQGQGALPPITLQPGSVNQPGGLPPITLAPIGGPQAPGQGQLRPPQVVPGPGPVTPLPGQPAPGGQTGATQPGVPPGFRIDPSGQLVPNAPIPGQTLGQSVPGGIPGQPLSPPPVNQPANQPDAGQGSPNSAVNAINQLLTNPRQTNTATATPTGANQIGAIAGIASTHKSPSIKVYKDQTKYELWEFVFSPTANTTPGAAAPGAGIPPNGQAPGGPGQPGGAGAPSTFGPSGTFGPSTFGSSNGQSTFGAAPGR